MGWLSYTKIFNPDISSQKQFEIRITLKSSSRAQMIVNFGRIVDL